LITMKTYMQTLKKAAGWSLALAGVLGWAQFRVLGAEASAGGARAGAVIVSESTNANLAVPAVGPRRPPRPPVVIKSIETARIGDRFGQKELPWLGAAVEEAPEVLTAQLGLDPGVGLVVTYVATNSPAAKAGLQKNDLLVEFEGQSLVHPLQLRKLVQVRKEGDVVKLVFYRAGKKQMVTATLAKTAAGFGSLDDAQAWESYGELLRPLGDMPIGDAVREQMKNQRELLGHLQIDQKKVQEEVRRAIEEAKKAYREALRSATNASSALGPLLANLANLTASLDNKATVTVRSTGQSAKSIVKADESGTIVIVSNPKLHLTVHDKDGKLVFDGEIETPEQRAQVPPDLWSKVEPLLDKLTPKAGKEP
jgi:membrane-associated protease RseP (regulator of RpoE activity)